MRLHLVVCILLSWALLPLVCIAYVWMSPDSTSIVMDSTGTFLAVTTNSAGVFTSKDGGKTFVQSTSASTSNSWSGLSASSDGSKLVAGFGWSSPQLYTSVDFGSTWTLTNDYNFPSGGSIYIYGGGCISGSANLMFEVPFLQLPTGQTPPAIYVSTSTTSFASSNIEVLQYGWTGSSVTALAASQDGSVFVFVLNNVIFKLTGASSTATLAAQVATAPAWTISAMPPLIALSSGGSVAVCATNDASQYLLLLSTDGGATYTSLPSFNTVQGVFTTFLTGLAISADGNTIVGFGNGYLYVSTDMGSTWSGSGFVQNAMNYGGSLALSSTGSLLAIALQGGPIMLSPDLGQTFVPVGLPVPQPTQFPTKQPTPRPSSPTYSPTPAPTPTPTTSMPSFLPTPSPTSSPTFSSPTDAPTARPTNPTSPPTSGQPTLGPTPLPTAACACPYFFQGSASVQVCQQCVQAASCCSYCPSTPAALCQTTSTVSPCQNAVTTYDACSGGSGGGGGGGGNSGSGDSSGVYSLSSSSLPSWLIAVIVLCVLCVVSGAFVAARWRWRLRTQTQTNALAQSLIPPLPFGRADQQHVLNPVFGDEGGRDSGGIRRLSAPMNPHSQY